MSVHDVKRRILERRRVEIQREWDQMLADADHWNRAHPDKPPIVIEPITQAEINAARRTKG